MPPNALRPPPKAIQKSPILNQRIKFRIRSLDLHQEWGIALVLLLCLRRGCPYQAGPLSSSRLGIPGVLGASGTLQRGWEQGWEWDQGSSRGHVCTGTSLHRAVRCFPSEHRPARLCNGGHTNKGKISSGWDQVPQDTPVRVGTPKIIAVPDPNPLFLPVWLSSSTPPGTCLHP